jgi:UDP-glucose 4-epimerase
MKVLVTGGAGFIGSHIVDALLGRGHEVWVADDMSSGRLENIPAVLRWECDITYGDGLLATVEGMGLDAICHQAAQPSLRKSIDDPAHDALVNIIGTLNVIAAAKAVGAHVVFASTSAVYDPAGGTFDEDSPIMPNLPYGIAKATAETYLRVSGISHTMLRYGNVYGPRQVQVGENQLVPHCLAHILTGAPFVINGDGEQTRDFVYVEDIARANVIAIEGRVKGTFNLGWGWGLSVNTVCETLAELCNWHGTLLHGPAKAGEARRVALDSSHAADVLGWQPTIPLVEGLRRTVSAWRER